MDAREQPEFFAGWWEAAFLTRDGASVDVSGMLEHIDAAANFTIFKDGERVGAGRHVEFTVDPDGFTNVPEVAWADGTPVRELAIYRLTDDLFEVCKADEAVGRPTSFGSEPGSGWVHAAIRRIDADDPRIPTSRPEVAVRTARLDDAEAMGRVHVAAWQAAYAGIMPDAFLAGLDPLQRVEEWRAAIERDPDPVDGRRLVGLLDGEVSGIAFVRSDRDGEPGVGEVVLINLAPHAFGTGLATALFAEGVDELRRRGFAEAILWVAAGNARAIRFYEREGWHPDGGEKTDEFDGAVVRELRYRRTL